MSRPQGLWRNPIVIGCALVGIAIGVLAGLCLPLATSYRATAEIAMVPGPDLTTADASAYWEVLTQGQVSRTAATVYADPRWLDSAAEAAGVRAAQLTLTAGALPETTMVSISADAPSAAAAQAAVTDLLDKATPEVGAVSAPFKVRVVSKSTSATAMTTSRLQVILAGALAGLLVGGAAGVGATMLRTRSTGTSPK